MALDTQHALSLDLQAKQDHQNFMRGLVMWLCAATFYSFQFLLRVSPNVMTNQLMADFDLQACTLGTIISFYYWGYSLMQIPAGIMLDAIGPRRPLTLACILCLLGCLSFALGGNVFFLSLGRVFIGIGSAFGFLTAVRIISTWFKAEKLGFFVGFTVLLGTMGALGGSSPLAKMLTLTTWQNCVLILAGFSALLALVAWFIIRDDSPQAPLLKKPRFSFTSVFLSIAEILRNPQTWLYAAYGFLMYIPISGFADLWGTPFLAERYKIDHTLASQGIFTFYIGVGAGCIVWPMLASKVKSYRKVMVTSAILTAFFLTLCFYAESLTFVQVCLALGLAGIGTAGQFTAFSGITDINPRDRAATASGMHNMFCMFSGNLMQPLLGYLLHNHWLKRQGTLIEGVPYYTQQDFNFALIVVPIAVLTAALVVKWMKETYPKD